MRAGGFVVLPVILGIVLMAAVACGEEATLEALFPTPAPTSTPPLTPTPTASDETPTPSPSPAPSTETPGVQPAGGTSTPAATAAPAVQASVDATVQATCQSALSITYSASGKGGAQVTRVRVMVDGNEAANSGAISVQTYGPRTMNQTVSAGSHTVRVEAQGTGGLSDAAQSSVNCAAAATTATPSGPAPTPGPMETPYYPPGY